MSIWSIWLQALALLLLASAAFTDIRYRRIPNLLTLFLLFCGIAIQFQFGMPDMAFSFGTAAGLLLIFFFFYHKKWVGGGDAKLLPVIVLLVPVHQIFYLLLSIGIFGALLAFLILIGRHICFGDRHSFESMWVPENPWRLSDQLKCDLPYAIAIFIAYCYTIVHENLL